MRIILPDIGPIYLERSSRAKRISISVKADRVRVAVPTGISIKKAQKFVEEKRDWIRKHVQRLNELQKNYQAPPTSQYINRTHAKAVLIHTLESLAQKHGFTYNRVFIKNQKTIWGSCSHKNNINLNYKLYILPDELQEYVILHEFVHLKIKNHSKNFWNELSRYCPDYKKIKKELKHYRIELM
ncbi:M48 family peptidase [bacterium]|nr:MAG: M48 family peptidase [bacterium]